MPVGVKLMDSIIFFLLHLCEQCCNYVIIRCISLSRSVQVGLLKIYCTFISIVLLFIEDLHLLASPCNHRILNILNYADTSISFWTKQLAFHPTAPRSPTNLSFSQHYQAIKKKHGGGANARTPTKARAQPPPGTPTSANQSKSARARKRKEAESFAQSNDDDDEDLAATRFGNGSPRKKLKREKEEEGRATRIKTENILADGAIDLVQDEYVQCLSFEE